MVRMTRAMKWLLAVWVAVLVGGAGWIAWDIVQARQDMPGAASIGGPFSLTDQSGKRVTEADFKGRVTLYYFGFTFCPDACPTSMLLAQTALEQLGKRADGKVQVVLVSVDPERDTPAVLKEYVEQFGPQFIGLTGSADEVASTARNFRVYYRKVPSKDGGPYLMDHSSVLYLMDRDGRFVQAFTHNSKAEDIAAAVAKQL
jgi:cytochrome oxidase Cu insertion factor (SCO1/SenC/PrrC family)